MAVLKKENALLKRILILALVLAGGILAGYLFYSRELGFSLTARPSRAEADSCSRKLAQLASPEGGRPAKPVEFKQSEIDAYVQHELAPQFPKGVEQVQIQLGQGSISANSRINFDELETSEGKKNPLLAALFRGEHALAIVAGLKSQNGMGSYEVSKVILDDREIPKPLVDMLIQKYIVAKYPAAKPNTPFPLPYKIDRVDVLPGKLVVHPANR
jgi:hypothetical protein